MPLAHLHPIIVHFTLTLGIGWCGWDLFQIFSRNQTGKNSLTKRETSGNLLEGLIILLIITVCTGWIALSMKERSMGPGAAFPPGDNHGDAALLTLFILLTRFLIGLKAREGTTNMQKSVFLKPLAAFFSFLALASFLVTGILGERLVFHYGVTAKKSARPDLQEIYASSALFKSRIRSSGSSSPTDTLKKPGSIPRAIRPSGDI
jgi:uncharacterized membrane protein